MIPKFSTTDEAKIFGQSATPEVVEELKVERERCSKEIEYLLWLEKNAKGFERFHNLRKQEEFIGEALEAATVKSEAL